MPELLQRTGVATPSFNEHSCFYQSLLSVEGGHDARRGFGGIMGKRQFTDFRASGFLDMPQLVSNRCASVYQSRSIILGKARSHV